MAYFDMPHSVQILSTLRMSLGSDPCRSSSETQYFNTGQPFQAPNSHNRSTRNITYDCYDVCRESFTVICLTQRYR
jgi:hypothetical protein